MKKPKSILVALSILVAAPLLACTVTTTHPDPSPTPEATRFTDPERTSPTAKTPRCEVQ
jgi:hypothetical protein